MCTTKYLYKIRNKIGDFYVVAKDANSAMALLLDLLNDSDYGYSTNREITNIEIIAVEEFYHTGKRRFSCDPYETLLTQETPEQDSI